ncbi:MULTISPECIES: carbohydrate ABC transporter permease [unclassified Lacrimispora]|uniref:carbohydrate ABC transporter permease n=1 Tax=unclassified Lacrimispora TaxID=2719232 RepID=UPI00376FD579
MRNKTYSKIYIMPAFIIFFTLFLLPSIIGLFYSFTNWNVMNQQIKFIGLDNYKSIFTDMRIFRVFGNTFFYAILTSVLKGFFGLLLALALNREIKSRNFLRTIFFLPMILSNLIVGLVFQQIFHPDTGVLNQFLNLIGIHSNLGWIINPKLVMWSCVAIEVWKAAGFNMIIFLAGLQLVPKEIYEASEVDGANAWQKFRSVTLPFIMPSIMINMLLNVISGLKVFDVIFALTNGGPGRASEVVNITIFKSFSMGNYGYGTALNTIMFVILAIFSVSVIQFYMKNEEVE